MPKSVAIVGAGPAGALTAYLLARMGIKVTLLERHSDLAREFRGEGVSPGGMRAIDQAGLMDEFDQLPDNPVRSFSFYYKGLELTTLEVAELLPDIGRFMRIMAQPPLLYMLIDKCRAFEGFEYIDGALVRDVIQTDGRVTGLSFSHADEEHEQNFDYVIAADGRSSLVAKRMGDKLEGRTQSFDIVWCKMPRPEVVPQGRAFGFLLEELFALGLPTGEDELQLGRIIPKGTFKEFRGGGESWFENMATSLPPVLQIAFRAAKDELAPPVLLDVVSGCMPKWSHPGLCYIGDAAHPMSPVGAQGINMALRDAVVVANHLGPLLLHDDAGEAVDGAAEAFEVERRVEIEKVQKEQDDALAGMARVKWFGWLIRLIPDSWLYWLAGIAIKRMNLDDFIGGVVDVRLTFKPKK